jgi:CrcB protein
MPILGRRTVRLTDLIRVFLGAGIGGVLRYWAGGWIADRSSASFPWHTFAINIAGAFAIGALMGLSVERGLGSSNLRLFLGVGILGGFTTFSTLSYESLALLESGLWAQGLSNMFGSVVAGLAAAAVGLLVGRAV